METSGHGEGKDKQKEEGRYEKVCYMCRRPKSKTGPMIPMPGGISLCHDCMQKAFDSVTKGGMGFSKLPNMPYMNMNLNDLNMTPPAVKIPKKQRIKKKTKEQPVLTMKGIPAPHVIKTKLGEYVIDQEKARKVVVVAVYSHYKRAFLDHPSRDVTVEDAGAGKSIVIGKSNILMIGPTGSSKTYLVRALARLLDVSLAIADVTSLTEMGYISDDIGSVASKLLAATDNDVGRAQEGIIFVDGVGKIVRKKQTNTRDASGESVQQELLELLGGSTVEVSIGSNQRNAITPTATVSAGDILFVYGDAFPDLEEIIKERLIKRTTVGFGSTLKDTYDKDSDILGQVTDEGLQTFRMTPEFLERLPMTVTPQGLTEDMMVRTLKEPKSAITRQYERLLEMDEIRLIFENEALKWIADETIKRRTEARALKTILEEFILDIMYGIPKDSNIESMVVTRPYLEKSGGPLIQMRG